MKVISNDKKKFSVRLGFDCLSLILDTDDKEIKLQFDSNEEITDMIEKLQELNLKYALVTNYTFNDNDKFYIIGDDHDHILKTSCNNFGCKEITKDNNTGNKS